MTKATMKHFDEYHNQLKSFTDMIARRYKNGESTDRIFERKYIEDIYDDYNNMIFSMHRFHVISDEDYNELFERAYELYLKYDTILLNVYFERQVKQYEV